MEIDFSTGCLTYIGNLGSLRSKIILFTKHVHPDTLVRYQKQKVLIGGRATTHFGLFSRRTRSESGQLALSPSSCNELLVDAHIASSPSMKLGRH